MVRPMTDVVGAIGLTGVGAQNLHFVYRAGTASRLAVVMSPRGNRPGQAAGWLSCPPEGDLVLTSARGSPRDELHPT